MRQRFYQIIEKYKLWKTSDRLLLAVSGGADSMVLLHLCKSLYNDIAIAHCNFHLRGEDSNADEEFVKGTAEILNIPCYIKHFDTQSYAREKGISIEMSARDLRYHFFEELCKKHHFDIILTAHHSNDNAETLLLNLIKGTGIRGLTGIPRKRDNIVRPLLDFSRKEIIGYANANDVLYCTDKTNSDNEYQRNKLRNEVIPLLEEINPSVVHTLNATTERMQEIKQIYQATVQEHLLQLVQKDRMQISALEKINCPASILYEWLTPLGFSGNVANDVLTTLSDTEEKIFYTEKYRLVKSRGYLILAPLKEKNKKRHEVTRAGISQPIQLNIEVHTGEIVPDKNIAYFDKAILQFPLTLRHWQEKDRFQPFGMKGTKKLSDFFKDLKMNTLQKENQWILCQKDQILWVIGQRTDERYKVKTHTKEIIKITYCPDA